MGDILGRLGMGELGEYREGAPRHSTRGVDFSGAGGRVKYERSPEDDKKEGVRGHARVYRDHTVYGELEAPGMDTTQEASPTRGLEENTIMSAPTETLYEMTKLRSLKSGAKGGLEWKSNVLESDVISRYVGPKIEKSQTLVERRVLMNSSQTVISLSFTN